MTKEKNMNKQNENIAELTYDELTHFEEFAIKHGKNIFIISAGLVILVALFLLIQKYSENQEIKISWQIANTQKAGDLNNIINKNPRHPAVPLAKLRLAKMLFDEKKYDDAMNIYKELVFSDQPEIAYRAKINFAYLLESMGKNSEAAAKFAEIGDQKTLPNDLLLEAKYNTARIYNSIGDNGKLNEALSFFSNLENSKKDSFWCIKAEKLGTGNATPTKKDQPGN